MKDEGDDFVRIDELLVRIKTVEDAGLSSEMKRALDKQNLLGMPLVEQINQMMAPVDAAKRIFELDYGISRFIQEYDKMFSATDQLESAASQLGVQSLEAMKNYESFICNLDATQSFRALQNVLGISAYNSLSEQLSILADLYTERNLLYQDAFKEFQNVNELYKLAKSSLNEFAQDYGQLNQSFNDDLMPAVEAALAFQPTTEYLKWFARYEDTLLDFARSLPDLLEGWIEQELGLDQPAKEELRRLLNRVRKKLPLLLFRGTRVIVFEFLFQLVLKPLFTKALEPSNFEDVFVTAISTVFALLVDKRCDQLWPKVSEFVDGSLTQCFSFANEDGVFECEVYNSLPENGSDRKIVLFEPGIPAEESTLIRTGVQIAKNVFPNHIVTIMQDEGVLREFQESDPYLSSPALGIYGDVNENSREYLWMVPIRRKKKLVRSMIIWTEVRSD